MATLTGNISSFKVNSVNAAVISLDVKVGDTLFRTTIDNKNPTVDGLTKLSVLKNAYFNNRQVTLDYKPGRPPAIKLVINGIESIDVKAE